MASRPKRERRHHERRPIRLKVVFRSARALVTEYTTSVSKGGCRIACRQPLAVGTRFVFEMYANRAEQPVEVLGEVMWCRPSAEPGMHDIGIRYLPSDRNHAALERMLDAIFAEHHYERARLHPRVPVNLIAQDAVNPERRHLVRDLSRGGMGLRLPADMDLPENVKPRTLVNLAVKIDGKPPIELGGEVVWTVQRRPGFTHAAVGVAFLGLGAEQLDVVDALTRLERPAELLLTFGTPR